MPGLLILLAAALCFCAWHGCSETRSFQNPVAYAVVGDTLFVLEKQGNNLLQLECADSSESLRLVSSRRIERDDNRYYYMVRNLHPGKNGVVTHSFVYERKTRRFVGYRFREYRSLSAAPDEILTVFPKDPDRFPEFSYSFDRDGHHVFGNNDEGHRNLWIIPPEGGVRVDRNEFPKAIRECGEENKALSNWGPVYAGPDGGLYMVCNEKGRIIQYTADGRKVREIGEAGFDKGRLLAPTEICFVALASNDSPRLTVASTGNRTWVQFDSDGRPVQTLSPLTGGYAYPDILAGRLYPHHNGGICAFDLANKSLVFVDRAFRSTTSYRLCRPLRSILLVAAALFLVLLSTGVEQFLTLRRKLKYPFCVKLLGLFIPLIVLCASVVADRVRDEMRRDLESEYVRRSANLAGAVLNNISVADLEAIQQPQDREGEAYRRIFDTVSRIVDTEKVEGTPKWIIHKIREGRFYFGINIWRGPIYEPFIVPRDREMFFKVLDGKSCQFGRFTDTQGEWFSYLAPIQDARGRVIYVLELYRATEDMDRADRQITRRVEKVVLAIILVSSMLIVLFSLLFTRPLRELTAATRTISRGHFDHQIRVHSRDELRDLGHAFNQMVVDLKKYTADLARSTAEQQKAQSELMFAREVQDGLLPKSFPPFPRAENIEIFARMEPAREIGGDFYDFFLVDPDHMGAVIADVSGKGVAAGLFMMVARTLLRDNALHNLSAADALAKVNAAVFADNPSSMFVTMFYLICDMRTGKVTFCNAGHLPPLWVRPGRVEVLETPGEAGHGMAVGVWEEARFADAEITLGAGDSLLLYTDGITEAVDQAGTMYGRERLIRAVETNRALSNAEQCDLLVADTMAYQKGLEQFDDITALFFKLLEKPMRP